MSSPIRTCLGCGAKQQKCFLARFTVNSVGLLILDCTGRLSGRGAYCCKNELCFSRLINNKKRLMQALRVPDFSVNSKYAFDVSSTKVIKG